MSNSTLQGAGQGVVPQSLLGDSSVDQKCMEIFGDLARQIV